MSVAQSVADPIVTPSLPDRKNRILDAAERCFVRTGFHRTTMQEIAAECGMSQGNLYRYFPSKDAMVAGLAERDREQFNGDFLKLVGSPDPAKAFIMLGHRHLVQEPRSKAIMMMEIWAESCRNPRMAEISAAMDDSIMDCMTNFITHWRAVEGVEGIGTPHEVAMLIMALSDGLFRRRATVSSFEASSSFALALPIIFQMVGAPLPDLSHIPSLEVPS
jgi:TetR/AcrR family transcriptional regulator, repressor for uid operon